MSNYFSRRQKRKQNYQKNRNKIIRYMRKYKTEWRKNNKDKIREHNRRYREKLKAIGIKYPNYPKKSNRIKIKPEKCQLCGYKEHPEILIAHHIVPRCKGGKDKIFNLQALCPNCHALIHLKEEIPPATPQRRKKLPKKLRI